MVNIEYRAGAMSRMVISDAGALSDFESGVDGYTSSGAFSGSDAMAMQMTGNEASYPVRLTIEAVRK
jgi:hypothetical protein